jgi:hypothetical protein
MLARTGKSKRRKPILPSEALLANIFLLPKGFVIAAAEQTTMLRTDQTPANHTPDMTASDSKPRPPTQHEVRQTRLAAELRANLKKRKALARGKPDTPADHRSDTASDGPDDAN